MKALIANLKDHPDLTILFEQKREWEEKVSEQIDFLKNRALAISKAGSEETKERWQTIEGLCAAKGLLPDWYDGKLKECNLEYKPDLGILIAKRKEKDSDESQNVGMAIFRQLFDLDD